MRFSERIGLVQPRTALQLRDIDTPLRNALWNVLTVTYFEWTVVDEMYGRRYATDELNAFIRTLWARHFNRAIDTIPSDWSDVLEEVRSYFLDQNTEWWRIYEFIEFCSKAFPEESEN